MVANDILIPDDIKNRIIKHLENNPKTLYFDRNDKVSDDWIDEALQNHDPYFHLINRLHDVNVDSLYDLEMEAIKEAIESVESELSNFAGIDEWEFNACELATQYRDDFIDFTSCHNGVRFTS